MTSWRRGSRSGWVDGRHPTLGIGRERIHRDVVRVAFVDGPQHSLANRRQQRWVDMAVQLELRTPLVEHAIAEKEKNLPPADGRHGIRHGIDPVEGIGAYDEVFLGHGDGRHNLHFLQRRLNARRIRGERLHQTHLAVYAGEDREIKGW